MVASSIFAVLAALGGAYAMPFFSSRATCATGIHIIVARGSNEKAGEGAMGAVAQNVVNQIPGSDSVGLVYPATLDNYISSESNGTIAMLQAVKSYVQACPKSKIVLMGYSQGGQVVLDTLCGTSEQGWNATNPTPYGSNILAAISFGDPSHVPGISYDVGTSTRQGVFDREKPACTTFASRIQSYCDAMDFFCDNGNSTAVHGEYVQKYGTTAANYVVKKYKS